MSQPERNDGARAVNTNAAETTGVATLDGRSNDPIPETVARSIAIVQAACAALLAKRAA
jgi:hypothetical protein